MSVGNQSIDWNIQASQNVQPFSIAISKSSNQSKSLPYGESTTAGGSSISSYTTENVPIRGNTESYMDFLNSSKWCNIIYSYHMIYNIFLLHHILEWKAYNLQLKQIQSTIFPLAFQSTLGDKIIFKFVSDRFCRGFCILSTSGCLQ